MSLAFSSMQPSAGIKVALAFCEPIKAKAVLGFHSPLCPPGLHRGEDKGITHCPCSKAPSLWAHGKFPTSDLWPLPSVFVCVYIYPVDDVCEPAQLSNFHLLLDALARVSIYSAMCLFLALVGFCSTFLAFSELLLLVVLGCGLCCVIFQCSNLAYSAAAGIRLSSAIVLVWLWSFSGPDLHPVRLLRSEPEFVSWFLDC